MKRKNLEKCIPLDALKKINEQYMWVWSEIENYREDNKKQNYSLWPNWCYIPVEHCLNLVCRGDVSVFGKPEWAQYARAAQIISALAPWRESKEIFVIDPDVEKILSEQTDAKVESEILTKLPYYGFYIKTNFLKLYDDNIDGFFVNLEYDRREKVKEIRFTYVQDNLFSFGLPLILKYQTIQETLDFLYKESGEETKYTKQINGQMFGLLNSSLQILLYILSINCDVKENPEQKKIYKPSNTEKKKEAKDKYNEIRKWDVGYRIGESVRANRIRIEREKENAEHMGHAGSHSSKRPHMRRGHWHNYWTGPKKGERKLVLKWVPPMFIGTKENSPVVYHEVK